MEDALVQHKPILGGRLLKGLNPCFNGRCTRTQNLGYALFKRIVRLNCASKDLYLTNFMYLFSECKGTYFYGGAQNFYVKISAKHIKC